MAFAAVPRGDSSCWFVLLRPILQLQVEFDKAVAPQMMLPQYRIVKHRMGLEPEREGRDVFDRRGSTRQKNDGTGRIQPNAFDGDARGNRLFKIGRAHV